MNKNGNYENIKINSEAIKDKLSSININEIFLKEYEQYIKEKYSSNDLKKVQNSIENITHGQVKVPYKNCEFQSFNALNEYDLENFLELKNLNRNEINFINKSEKQIDKILKEKIDKMKNSKFDNFEDKEKNYLEIIEILYRSVKEIEEMKLNNSCNKVSSSISKNHLKSSI